MSESPKIEGQPPAKRVKLSPESAEEKGPKGTEKKETIRRYIPESVAGIEHRIRCLLIEYILSPDFFANVPPNNFVYYRPFEGLLPLRVDMSRYDPLQFITPVQLPHPFDGTITSHIFNVLCDVRTLNCPDITHLRCWMTTYANVRYNPAAPQFPPWMIRGVKFNVLALNHRGGIVTRQNWVKDFDEQKGLYLRRTDDEEIKLELTILEDQIWMDDRGFSPKIENGKNWPSLVSFVRSSIQRAFNASGEYTSVGQIEGIQGRGYVDAAGIMVI